MPKPPPTSLPPIITVKGAYLTDRCRRDLAEVSSFVMRSLFHHVTDDLRLDLIESAQNRCKLLESSLETMKIYCETKDKNDEREPERDTE